MTNSSANLFLYLNLHFQVAAMSNSSDMTTVFYAWAYGKYIEIKNTLRRENVYRTKATIYLEVALPIQIIKKITLWPLFMDGIQLPQGQSHFKEAAYFLPLRTPIKFSGEKQFHGLKKFYFKNKPILFTSIVTTLELPELLDWS